ncbi:inositol hexakisphosphate and diphosphoinositol-pentakisphosphate kinase isoform X3 [Vespula squamosa]|uniref:Inositol hexakisphosphate and diphosphoinositol-pentakisphosphate kinase isoform X3 n=1 Tax=Vespula squamosa TaxID=30214 RepID=A0ABD2AFZ9_VESSQ
MESINPSMSIASTSEVFPEVYILDNEAEPYWLIMMFLRMCVLCTFELLTKVYDICIVSKDR